MRQVDGSKVRLFGTKANTIEALKAIQWPVKAACRVQTRFCIAWAICTGIRLDPYTELPYVSREWFGELANSVGYVPTFGIGGR
jgi:hypothetical protein